MTFKEKIIELVKTGKTAAEIAECTGAKKSYVYNVTAELKLRHIFPSNHGCAKRYDWKSVQEFYDAGHDRYACLEQFKISAISWDNAGKSGRLKLRPNVPREDVFSVRKFRSTTMLRFHLSKIGWLKNKCSKCGLAEWLNAPLTIQIDHVNGDHADNRLDNLRELCPNCHSQTPTYGNKQKRHTKMIPEFKERVKKKHGEGVSILTIAAQERCSPAMVAHAVSGWKRIRYA